MPGVKPDRIQVAGRRQFSNVQVYDHNSLIGLYKKHNFTIERRRPQLFYINVKPVIGSVVVDEECGCRNIDEAAEIAIKKAGLQ